MMVTNSISANTPCTCTSRTNVSEFN